MPISLNVYPNQGSKDGFFLLPSFVLISASLTVSKRHSNLFIVHSSIDSVLSLQAADNRSPEVAFICVFISDNNVNFIRIPGKLFGFP